MNNQKITAPTFDSGLFIGLMSGTSLDGVDAVLMRFEPDTKVEFARTYGLKFSEPPREMDLSLSYQALASGQVDVIAGNSTDGLIDKLGLYQLEDDRHYFPPYEAAPVVRPASTPLAVCMPQTARLSPKALARLIRAVLRSGAASLKISPTAHPQVACPEG